MNTATIPPRTVFVDYEHKLRIYNDGDRYVEVKWGGVGEPVYRVVKTTPEEDREAKAFFINDRGIADGSGRWISRNTRGATTTGTDTETDRPSPSEDRPVDADDEERTEPTDVRLNIFKLFE